MIESRDGRLFVQVPMTLVNARGLLEAGRAAFRDGETVFDLSQVADADSSAIAVMLGWLRQAAQLRSTIKFTHIPGGVRSLAELYGLTEHLPQV